LIQRTVERDLIPMARAFDMAVTPWAALGGGVLSGKYTKTDDKVEANDSKRIQVMNKRLSDRNFAIAKVVQEIADERGASPSQVAIAWLLRQPGLMIPIIGARTAAQVTDNIGAIDVELATDDLAKLDDVSRIELGFPHEFLASDNIREVIFGKTFASIDSHRDIL
jgi:aryl-alcohol dehydrogenase-like predicted oxidoreductase